MSETPLDPMTEDQKQRSMAVTMAAEVLRDGGAGLFANNGKAGPVNDVIELAEYIVSGDPYSVRHKHDHIREATALPMVLQFEDLTSAFNNLFTKGAPEKDDDEPDLD